jgi:hypothetical protein
MKAAQTSCEQLVILRSLTRLRVELVSDRYQEFIEAGSQPLSGQWLF